MPVGGRRNRSRGCKGKVDTTDELSLWNYKLKSIDGECEEEDGRKTEELKAEGVNPKGNLLVMLITFI